MLNSRRHVLAVLMSLSLINAADFLAAQTVSRDSSAGAVQVQQIISGLDTPWAMAFLPEGGMLITERDGRLLYRDAGGTISEIEGVPEVRDAKRAPASDPASMGSPSAVPVPCASPTESSLGLARASASAVMSNPCCAWPLGAVKLADRPS